MVWERSPNLEQNISPPPQLLISKEFALSSPGRDTSNSDYTSGGNPVTRLNEPVIIPCPLPGTKTCRCTGSITREKLNIFWVTESLGALNDHFKH